MSKRRVLGENPLDLIVPWNPPSGQESTVEPVEPAPSESTERVRGGSGSADSPVPAAGSEQAALQRADTNVETPPVEPADREDAPEALSGQYVSFFLSGDEYAVNVSKVKEIIEFETLTRVPLTPAWIRGVLNLRGSVVPVIDLAVKFGLPETEVTDRTCVVIVEIDLEGSATVMGAMVDAVSQVLELESDQIEAAPAFGTNVNVDFLLGMGTVEEQFILILDMDRILSSNELLAVQSIDEADLASEDDNEDEARDAGAPQDRDGAPASSDPESGSKEDADSP